MPIPPRSRSAGSGRRRRSTRGQRVGDLGAARRRRRAAIWASRTSIVAAHDLGGSGSPTPPAWLRSSRTAVRARLLASTGDVAVGADARSCGRRRGGAPPRPRPRRGRRRSARAPRRTARPERAAARAAAATAGGRRAARRRCSSMRRNSDHRRRRTDRDGDAALPRLAAGGRAADAGEQPASRTWPRSRRSSSSTAGSARRRATTRASPRSSASCMRLGDDETLLVQSGKPVAVFETHAAAPRVLIANSNLVGALGELGDVPRARRGRADDVRPDDRGVVDLHRHPGDPPGHLRDVRGDRPPALRRLAARGGSWSPPGSAGWAARSRSR